MNKVLFIENRKYFQSRNSDNIQCHSCLEMVCVILVPEEVTLWWWDRLTVAVPTGPTVNPSCRAAL